VLCVNTGDLACAGSPQNPLGLNQAFIGKADYPGILSAANTWPGVQSFIGSNTSPINANGARLVVQNSATTQGDIFTGITGGVVYDLGRFVLDIPAGSGGVLSANAIGMYVRNRSGTGASAGGGVGLYGLIVCGVTGSNCWYENSRVVDCETTGTGCGTLSGINLVASEDDFFVYNPATQVNSRGSILGGIQPSFAIGNSCSVSDPPITNIAGSASPYTISFGAFSIKYPVGQTIKVYGAAPASLNGNYTVTASTSSTVTATTTATGAYTSGGHISGSVFTFCMASLDGAAQMAFNAGAVTAGGISVPSQFINFAYYNAAGSSQAWRLNVDANGNLMVASTEANKTVSVPGNFFVGGEILNTGIPTSAGAGGLFVCVDSTGIFYKKATCP
jgi:hypothetical protein